MSETSMMPDDQLKQFSKHEVLSLFAYLAGRQQVPMLATKDNVGNFFNGKDLTGWSGDTELWSVENGEVVGRTKGLKHNTFLMSDLGAKISRSRSKSSSLMMPATAAFNSASNRSTALSEIARLPGRHRPRLVG